MKDSHIMHTKRLLVSIIPDTRQTLLTLGGWGTEIPNDLEKYSSNRPKNSSLSSCDKFAQSIFCSDDCLCGSDGLPPLVALGRDACRTGGGGDENDDELECDIVLPARCGGGGVGCAEMLERGEWMALVPLRIWGGGGGGGLPL